MVCSPPAPPAVSTTSCGASGPASRLAYRIPDGLSPTSAMVTSPLPFTSGVTLAVIHLRGRNGAMDTAADSSGGAFAYSSVRSPQPASVTR